MTRRIAALGAVFAFTLAATARADGGHVKAPDGWSRQDAQAKSLTDKTNAVKHFGGATSMASAEAYVAPAGSGAGLYVTTVVAKVVVDRDAAARAEVDSFLGAPERARLTSKNITVAKSSSAVDAAKKQLDATLSWGDAEAGLSSTSRLIVVGDADNLIAVSAECSYGDQPGADVDACLAALDTLDPGIPPEHRVAVALAANAPDMLAMPVVSDVAPTMSDGRRSPLPPIVVSTPPTRTVDRRPVYVGLGIIVLAALFWWNRRRRERLEASDSKDNDGR